MVAIGIYGKSLYGSGYRDLRENITFLPFLFRFLIINLYNFSYIFTLHHRSAIFWYFILRLIRLRQWSTWDCCNVWKGAFYDYYLLIPVVAFCNRGICLVFFSSPRSTSSFISFIVNNIIICSEVSFS